MSLTIIDRLDLLEQEMNFARELAEEMIEENQSLIDQNRDLKQQIEKLEFQLREAINSK